MLEERGLDAVDVQNVIERGVINSKVLAVVPETLSRWENGKQTIPQAAEIATREMVMANRRADEYQPPEPASATEYIVLKHDGEWRPKVRPAA